MVDANLRAWNIMEDLHPSYHTQII